MSEPLQAAPRIMIVDDKPQNLELLESLLQAQGYQVFALPNGEMALRAAAHHQHAARLLHAPRNRPAARVGLREDGGHQVTYRPQLALEAGVIVRAGLRAFANFQRQQQRRPSREVRHRREAHCRQHQT